jgi:dipeptidyl aminopeptidase/acylaminoacyl peptidase
MLAMDVPTMVKDSLGTDPWVDRGPYLKQSPHLLANNCATPTLVVHGEPDFRVPVSQGFEHYNTLRSRGVPARLLYFPDEGHFIRKPQNSQRWDSEIMDWLARFAPGGATE